MGKQSLTNSPSEFSPVPAALLTFRAASGHPRCLSVNWLSMVCGDSAILSAAFRAVGSVLAELRSVENFAVNLPPQELLLRPEFRRGLAAAAGESGRPDGLSLSEGSASETPALIDCPVRIECHKVGLRTMFGHGMLRGRILEVHLGGRRYGCDEGIDFCRINPLTSLHNTSPPRRL